MSSPAYDSDEASVHPTFFESDRARARRNRATWHSTPWVPPSAAVYELAELGSDVIARALRHELEGGELDDSESAGWWCPCGEHRVQFRGQLCPVCTDRLRVERSER